MSSANSSILSTAAQTHLHSRLTDSPITHAPNTEEETKVIDDEAIIHRRKRAKKQKHDSDEDMHMAAESRFDSATATNTAAASIESSGSTPRHVISPIQRCDANSFSVIFSFLRSKEFSSAIRVSHFWHAIGEMNTAWPEFNLEAFIQQLESENYLGCGQRRLVLDSPNHLTDALSHQIMKKANDIILRSCSTKLPVNLAEFTHLTALNVTLTSEVDTAAFTRVMENRLRVLIVSAPWTHVRVLSTLNELTALRVLVTDFPIESNQLEQLTQLEYLHVNHSYFLRRDNIRSVRLLSVYHSLRHFSLEYLFVPPHYRVNWSEKVHQGWAHDLQLETQIPSPDVNCLAHLTNEWNREVLGASEPISVPPARLISFGLVTKYRESIALPSMPDLVRLSCTSSTLGTFSQQTDELLFGLSCLQVLHLGVQPWWGSLPDEIDLPGLRYCTALKTLYLTSPSWVRHGITCDVTIEPYFWPQLEELAVSYPLGINHDSIKALLACQHLRRLDLSNRPIIDLDQIAPILSQLPEFQTLELTVWPYEPEHLNYDGGSRWGVRIPPTKPFVLPTSFMQHVSHSSTWSSLHLHLSDQYLDKRCKSRENPWSIELSQLALRRGGLIDLATTKRFCLQVHPYESSGDVDRVYRVVTNVGDGRQSWCEI